MLIFGTSLCQAAVAVLLLALAVLSSEAAGREAQAPSPPVIMTYHDSWYERRTGVAAGSSLAAIAAHVDVVALAFVKPDLIYRGDLDLTKTGLEYPYSRLILRDAIDLLKRRQPWARVIVSIGGATYTAWNHLNEVAIARLVVDLGADGVDLDYEPAEPHCKVGPDEHIRCDTDNNWTTYVSRIRSVLPRPFLLSVSAWSVGAYGEGKWRLAHPYPSRYTGFMLGLLRSPAASLIDLISICAYDAGPSYSPMEAFLAYRDVWKGLLILGVEGEVPNGLGPFFTVDQVENLARNIARDPNSGIMVYPMLGGPVSAQTGTKHSLGVALLKAACRGLGKTSCP